MKIETFKKRFGVEIADIMYGVCNNAILTAKNGKQYYITRHRKELIAKRIKHSND